MKFLRTVLALLLVLSMLPLTAFAEDAAAENSSHAKVLQALQSSENLLMEETDAPISGGPEMIAVMDDAGGETDHTRILQELNADGENILLEEADEIPEGVSLVMPAAAGDYNFYERESNNSTGTADRIYHDYTVSGYVSGYDLDYFKFTLDRRSKVNIVALADYSSFAMLVLDSWEDSLGVAANGRYYQGYYAYSLSGTLSSGTYYICTIDTAARSTPNVYTFHLEIEGGTSQSLSAPNAKISADYDSGKPKITWDEVSGASNYTVYRATSKNGTYNFLDSTYARFVIDTEAIPGKKYYYKVTAASSDGRESSYSNIVSRTCDLAKPQIKLSALSSSGGIKISWTAISGAEKYEVYRSTSKNGTYKRISTTTKTYINNTKNLTPGKTYYYKVKAIHSNSEANSAYSSYKYRTCDLPRPDVEITRRNGDPRLTWDKISGAKEYNIYRATSKNGTYKLIRTTTATSYTNTSAKAGTTYYYKVKAIHKNTAANSAYSSVRSITAK